MLLEKSISFPKPFQLSMKDFSDALFMFSQTIGLVSGGIALHRL